MDGLQLKSIVDETPTNSITSLPIELLDEVLVLLSPSEWKALRLTSRALEVYAAQFLFRRIRLSTLRVHYEAFLEISTSSRLSRLPRQLVWYECNPFLLKDKEKVQDWYSCREGAETTVGGESHQELRELCNELASNIQTIEWMPTGFLVDSTLDPRLQGAPKSFIDRLAIAFEALPNIQTFISRAAPDDLVLSNTGYKFTAGIVPDLTPGLRNMGLAIILTYISTSSNANIKNLYWADAQSLSSSRYLGDACVEAFKHFTSIDICLSRFDSVLESQKLISALCTARDLKNLKVCFEQQRDEYGFLGQLSKHKANDQLNQPIWSSLSSFTVVEAEFRMDHLLNFLQRHAASIRHLRLHMCIYRGQHTRHPGGNQCSCGWNNLMEAMANLKKLNLNSIEILQTRRGDYVNADKLVQFINNKGPSPFTGDQPYKFIMTNEMVQLPDDYVQWSPRGVGSGSILDAAESPLTPRSYWVLRRVQNFTVWWDQKVPGPGAYETEKWLFEHKDGSFAYGDDPWEYFSDWESDGDGDDDSSDSSDSEALPRRNFATESPFGPTFDAFCKKGEWGQGDPRNLYFPDHAMILLDEGKTIPWRQYRESCRRQQSWKLVENQPTRMRADPIFPDPTSLDYLDYLDEWDEMDELGLLDEEEEMDYMFEMGMLDEDEEMEYMLERGMLDEEEAWDYLADNGLI